MGPYLSLYLLHLSHWGDSPVLCRHPVEEIFLVVLAAQGIARVWEVSKGIKHKMVLNSMY
jgi:hypothetical protein